MDTQLLKNYLQEHEILSGATIEPIGFGESNVNYLASRGDKKIIVRMARSDVPTEPRFYAEHHYLTFINSIGIKFAPKSIHYDPLKHIHVISYISGEDASVLDLTEDQALLFVKQVKQLHNITRDTYMNWCKVTQTKAIEVQSASSRVKIYIDDRLAYIKKQRNNEFATEVVKWAEVKLEKLSLSRDKSLHSTKFFHGDLRWNKGGGNLRVAKGKVYFIDWELSEFINDGMPEIADIIGSIPHVRRDIMKRLYDRYITNELEVDRLNLSIEYGILWGKLGNPLWAAERYFLMTDAGQQGVERYKQLAKQGMEDANYYYNAPFSNWFQD